MQPESCSDRTTGEPVVVRLRPGDDLRLTLEALARGSAASWTVLGEIGSLRLAMLRFAGAATAARLAGPLEIISLAGTVCADGAHLHTLVADGAGAARGGHVCPGSLVSTTAEVTLLPLPGVRLGRSFDPATGYEELEITPLTP